MTQTIPNHRGNRRWIILLVIAFIAFMQWSTIKDLYYQVVGSPESTIPWLHQADAAFEAARTSDKPILAVFGASWCPPCRAMKREVWADTQVSDAVEAGFIPLYIDVDDESQSEFVARYRINGIPAVLVLDASGNVQQQRQWMSRSSALEFLERTKS